MADKNMQETLEEVHKNIPKLFVNLVLLGDILGLRLKAASYNIWLE